MTAGLVPIPLRWAQRLQALAQNGLTYAVSEYDRERYDEIGRIAAEMLSNLSGCAESRIAGLFLNERGYATPKVDVRGGVFSSGRILLVREREDGGWTLPGGWADVGQSAAECVVREIREESGFETRAVKLLAVWDRNKHPHPPIPFHAYKLAFLCELTGGAPRPSTETSEVGFFDENALPPLSQTRVLADQIRHLFDHLRHPEWPTTFD